MATEMGAIILIIPPNIEVLRYCESRARKNIDPVYDAPQAGDVKHSLADITRAREELSYEPKFDISKGLEETVKWFQKQI